jgi:hypothetical protein
LDVGCVGSGKVIPLTSVGTGSTPSLTFRRFRDAVERVPTLLRRGLGGANEFAVLGDPLLDLRDGGGANAADRGELAVAIRHGELIRVAPCPTQACDRGSTTVPLGATLPD